MLQINEIAMNSVVQARQHMVADTMEASRRRSALAARLGFALIRIGESLQQERQSTSGLLEAASRPQMSQG